LDCANAGIGKWLAAAATAAVAPAVLTKRRRLKVLPLPATGNWSLDFLVIIINTPFGYGWPFEQIEAGKFCASRVIS
jgi:hypothetical protein